MKKLFVGSILTLALISQPLFAVSSVKPKPVATPVPSPTATATPSGLVTVVGGTTLHVALTDKISSATAKVGDTFTIHSTDDVIVDGWIAIPKGAGGQGEVVTVDHAGSHGHPGSLSLQMDWIFAADGEKIRLTSQQKTEEGEGKQGASSTLTVVSWLAFGLPGLFAHNFVHGHDVEVDSSKVLDCYTADTVHVVATTKEADGFAH